MSITTVDDRLVHYEALGRGDPLIFVHGWLGSWRYWWPAMQALSAHHRSFAFDLWGFGDSSKAPEKYSLNAYVDMLDQFVDKLGIVRPVTLVGHALGAAVALRYATRANAKVKRLVAVSLPIEGQDLHDRLANSDSDAFVSRVIGESDSFPEINSELRKTDAQALNTVARQMMAENFARDLDACQCPVLLVFGAQDPVVKLPSGEYAHFREGNERRASITLEACNHFPMLEETAKFNRLILDFLRANSNLQELSPKDYWKRRTY